jgi:hypothetical protein
LREKIISKFKNIFCIMVYTWKTMRYIWGSHGHIIKTAIFWDVMLQKYSVSQMVFHKVNVSELQENSIRK